jgi:hypothetical protein
MKDLGFYQSIAQEMVQKDGDRDRMMSAMEQMWRGEWALPRQVADMKWIHKVVSTDPHDALRAGTRVLSSVAPRIKVHPLGPNEESRASADKIERALTWHFNNASRRRRASVLRDVVLSALLYDEVVAQVVYLPRQIEAVKAFNGDARRLEAARRFGPFAVLVRNPRQVHVRYSDWMPEAVLMKRVMPVQEAIDFWGRKANKLKRTLKERDFAEMKYVTLYDYMDLDVRVVWAVPQVDGAILTAPAGAEGTGGVEILREKHELGFLPWVAKVGGTTLEDDPAHQRVPLLYSVYNTKQWETQNILETLMASEVIAYAASPRLKVQGPSDEVEVNYGEPGRMAYVPPGHDLSNLAPPGMDVSLAVIADRVAQRMGKSTVPRVLQTGDFPSGTAFATLNLATQSGIKSLTPYKELAEQALADVFTHMLYWIHHSGEAVVAYGRRRDDPGEQFTLTPEEVDVENVYIDVELTADVPSDRMARVNAASMAVRELGYSKERALEQIGEDDPQVILTQARAEALDEAALEVEKREVLALGEIKTKQKVAELEGEQKKDTGNKTTDQINKVMKNPGFIQRMLGGLRKQRGISGVGGPGFGPSKGGTPPAMAAPEITPENSGKPKKEIEGT